MIDIVNERSRIYDSSYKIQNQSDYLNLFQSYLSPAKHIPQENIQLDSYKNSDKKDSQRIYLNEG